MDNDTAALVARLMQSAITHLLWAAPTEAKPATIMVEAADTITAQAAEIARDAISPGSTP